MLRTGIKAVDYYVPEKVVTNDDLSTIVETNDEWIASRTGIRRVICQQEKIHQNFALKWAKNYFQKQTLIQKI